MIFIIPKGYKNTACINILNVKINFIVFISMLLGVYIAINCYKHNNSHPSYTYKHSDGSFTWCSKFGV